jgi:16S rRNA (cytidine1402-2'-O)-methyltransferase
VPRLIVVPTPIGNLDDITLRALKVLGEASLVLAEDTRHTRQLLVHHDISARLLSYHQHNKRERLTPALQALRDGDVALVSNAGMPSISDPGFELVQAAIADGIEIDVLPGASAVITAVVGAAIPAPGFLFFGFLPRHTGERRARLDELKLVRQSLVFYEAPHRTVHALRDMVAVLGDRSVVIARELTKLHQEWIRGNLEEVRARFGVAAPRGELTILVAGATDEVGPDVAAALEHMRVQRLAGESRKAVIDEVSHLFGLARNKAYRMWLDLEREAKEQENAGHR